jgi:transposase-like protein
MSDTKRRVRADKAPIKFCPICSAQSMKKVKVDGNEVAWECGSCERRFFILHTSSAAPSNKIA